MPGTQRRAPRSQFFRANVGIAVLNAGGQVLAPEREGYPGSWQLPQGGLEVGEEPLDAAGRELGEETSLRWDQVALLGEYPDKGTRESRAYAWMSFAEVLGRAVPFRLGVYRRVAEHARTLGAA